MGDCGMNNFIQHYKNAKTCIAQIKRGEWTPRWNSLSEKFLTAHRNGMELWIGNGAWFVDIDEKNYFGLLFRHWVWHAAAWRLHRVKAKKEPVPVLADSLDQKDVAA
jgi:hypothetical protein